MSSGKAPPFNKNSRKLLCHVKACSTYCQSLKKAEQGAPSLNVYKEAWIFCDPNVSNLTADKDPYVL